MTVSVLSPTRRTLVAALAVAVLVLVWALLARASSTGIVPTPWATARGIVELARSGKLVRHEVASLFRLTWGYLAAVVLGVPAGLALGWFARAGRTLGPLVQLFRPISPLAWIPIAILWFGVGDASSVFIIFLGAFFPIVIAAAAAARRVPVVHVRVARNFGLSTARILREVVLPAALPELWIGLRLALGIAWIVVVAAEMIAVNSGLGFLIIESRNAGNRFDLVLGGMVLIGATGLALDAAVARLARAHALAHGGTRR